MKITEYQNSVADIRALISQRETHRGKFVLFNLNDRLQGIWNCTTRNVIVVLNREQHFMRIRRNSVYLQALSCIEGWKVAKSDTLHRYRYIGGQHHLVAYLPYVAEAQIKAINSLGLTTTDMEIDLGEHLEDRLRVITYIQDGVINPINRIPLHGFNLQQRRHRVTFTTYVTELLREPEREVNNE